MNLKKIGKIFTSKFVGTGPWSYKKRIYLDGASQRLRNTAVLCCMWFSVHMIFHPSPTAVLNKDCTNLTTEVTKPRFVFQSEEAVVSETRSDR